MSRVFVNAEVDTWIDCRVCPDQAEVNKLGSESFDGSNLIL
jgi:hypothetical protein